MKQFYSYLWLREDGTPYYAGKGSGKRAFALHGRFHPPADRARIIIFPMDDEAMAFESEIALIDLFGRKDLGTGILHNRTDGGENPPRAKKGRRLSLAARHNMSVAKLGKPILNARGLKRSEATKQNMRKPRTHSWTLSAEDKQKRHETAIRREAKKKEQGVHQGQAVGYKHTDAAKNKISLAKKGKPGHRLTREHIAAMAAGRKGKKRGPYKKKREQI